MTGHSVNSLPTVILGVAESDAHAVGNQLLAIYLREHGYEVVNLGACTPLGQFADALAEHPGTLAILIGSLNGHAYEDLRELPALREQGRITCPVIVGGNLSVGGNKRRADELRLVTLGVDHVLNDMHQLLPLLDLMHVRTARRSVQYRG